MFEFLRRKRSSITRPWFGPLALAEPEVIETLHTIPSFDAITARGWDSQKTLLYVPVHSKAFETEIYVVGRMFAWDDKSPVTWIFSTMGLCRIEQPDRAGRAAFRRFELVVATNNSEKEDPFPARLGVVLSMGANGLPSWDWSQVKHPPLMQWLAVAAQDVASSMKKDGAHFALTDTLAQGPGRSPWTRSLLDNSVLLPATPHMLAIGLAPFNRPTDPADPVEPQQWHTSAGQDRFEYGFYWWLPLSEAERKKADAGGTWSVFADLVELAPDKSQDDCDVAFNWLRTIKPAPTRA